MSKGTNRTSRNLMAASLYIQDGWTRKQLKDSNGGFCLVAAIQMAILGRVSLDHPRNSEYQDAITKMRKHLGVYDLAVWNNSDDRTQDEVVKALHDCALEAA